MLVGAAPARPAERVASRAAEVALAAGGWVTSCRLFYSFKLGFGRSSTWVSASSHRYLCVCEENRKHLHYFVYLTLS